MGMARLVSLGIVAALIACLGITFYQVIAPFLMPLFLAAMIALLCQPVLKYFLKRTKGRRSLAASLTTVAIVGSVMLPIVVTVLLGILKFITIRDPASEKVAGEITELRQKLALVSDEAYDWVFHSPDVSVLDRTIFGDGKAAELEKLEADFREAEQNKQVDDTEPVYGPLETARREWLLKQVENVRAQSLELMKSLAFKTAGVVGSTITTAVSSAVNRTADILAASVGAMIAMFVFTLALYYFLLDGPDMLAAAQSLIPVEKVHQQELMLQFAGSVRSVVLATFLAAFGQGVATSIALQVVGFGHFFVIVIIATFAALIPMAGTWLVWGPCAVWLIVVDQSWGSAIFLAVVGIGLIGMMDNVIRTWVLKNDTSLHPLLAFVSVLGGLQVMGLWGVFIGPIVACCLHSLVEIFNSELREVSPEESKAELPSGQPDTAAATQTDEPVVADSESEPGSESETATTTANGIDEKPGPSRESGQDDSSGADGGKSESPDS